MPLFRFLRMFIALERDALIRHTPTLTDTQARALFFDDSTFYSASAKPRLVTSANLSAQDLRQYTSAQLSAPKKDLNFAETVAFLQSLTLVQQQSRPFASFSVQAELGALPSVCGTTDTKLGYTSFDVIALVRDIQSPHPNLEKEQGPVLPTPGVMATEVTIAANAAISKATKQLTQIYDKLSRKTAGTGDVPIGGPSHPSSPKLSGEKAASPGESSLPSPTATTRKIRFRDGVAGEEPQSKKAAKAINCLRCGSPDHRSYDCVNEDDESCRLAREKNEKAGLFSPAPRHEKHGTSHLHFWSRRDTHWPVRFRRNPKA